MMEVTTSKGEQDRDGWSRLQCGGRVRVVLTAFLWLKAEHPVGACLSISDNSVRRVQIKL